MRGTSKEKKVDIADSPSRDDDEKEEEADGSLHLRRRSGALAESNVAIAPGLVFGETSYWELHNDETLPEIILSERRRPKEEDVGPAERLVRAAWKAFNNEHPGWQAFVIVLSTFLTFSVSTRAVGGVGLGPNLSQAAVTTLASLAFPHMAAPFAVGAYTGMTGKEIATPDYGWLALHAALSAATWWVFSKTTFLSGYSGRLGTCAFTAGIPVMVIVGATTARSTEDWADLFRSASYWEDLTLEYSVVTVLFVTLSALATECVRRVPGMTAVMANPVASGSAIGNASMLVVSCTGYSLSGSVMAAIGQGTFVGMASDEMIPGHLNFALAGVASGGCNLLLFPFFRGWGGKQGLMAFLGCLVHLLLRSLSSLLMSAVTYSSAKIQKCLAKHQAARRSYQNKFWDRHDLRGTY